MTSSETQPPDVHTARRSRRRIRTMIAAITAGLLVVSAGCTTAGGDTSYPMTATLGPTSSATSAIPGTGLLSPDGNGGDYPSATSAADPMAIPETPRVITLEWLDGVPDESGISLEASGGSYWQGPVSGETAWLTADHYQWFGVDGAAVGCVIEAGCVGIDGAGYVATLSEVGALRHVYDPNGDFVARFDGDGNEHPIAANASPGALREAILATGVDMPALLEAATMRPVFAGGATGDPHVITAGGVRISTQVTGQFMARGGDPNRGIQLELTTMGHHEDVSVVAAVALEALGEKITVNSAGTVVMRGHIHSRPGRFIQTELANGVAVGRWPAMADHTNIVLVRWPDGGTVSVTANPALGLTVIAHFPRDTAAHGLFGDTEAAPADDMVSRYPSTRTIAGAVNSWRVTESERLFDSPMTVAVRSADQGVAIPDAAQRVAETVCRDGGVVRPQDVAACAFDVGVTGDTGFLSGHLALTAAAPSRWTLPGLAENLPALLLTGVVDPVAVPADGRVDETLAVREKQVIFMTFPAAGDVRMTFAEGCGEDQLQPGWGAPAARVFNAAGDAVSARLPLCGQVVAGPFAAGDYTLLIANGDGAPLPLRVDIVID